MGRRNQQHMGRSDDDRRELVGRDIRDGDELADQANEPTLPLPNEEGTGHRAGTPEEEPRGGGSESREVSG